MEQRNETMEREPILDELDGDGEERRGLRLLLGGRMQRRRRLRRLLLAHLLRERDDDEEADDDKDSEPAAEDEVDPLDDGGPRPAAAVKKEPTDRTDDPVRMMAGAALVYTVLFWKGKFTGTNIARILQQTDIPKLATIILIVLAASLLGLLRVIAGEAVIALLSGIAGYVLGNRSAPKEEAAAAE